MSKLFKLLTHISDITEYFGRNTLNAHALNPVLFNTCAICFIVQSAAHI